MPKAVEDALKRSAAKRGLSGERKDRYVYGYMQKRGLLKKSKKKKHTMDQAGAALSARMKGGY